MLHGKIRTISLCLLCFILAIVVSCDGSQQVPAAQDGTLTVQILDSQARGVTPDFEVASYEIKGVMDVDGATGPSFGPVCVDKDQGSYTASVAAGAWTVTVDALTKDGFVVGSGSEKAAVVAGKPTTVAVHITEKEGQGQLNINFEDLTGKLDNLSAVVTDAEGNEVKTVTLQKDIDGVHVGDCDLENGFYMVTIKADGNPIMDESVRIYADITTQYSVTYDGDGFTINIVDEIIKTPSVILTADSGTVASNGTLNAQVAVDGLSEYSVSWTLDAKEIESSYTLDDNILVYDLSQEGFTQDETIRLTVFVTSGAVIWSESVQVTVTSAVTLPESVGISISPASPSFGDTVTLTATGSFEEGTSRAWTVDGTPVETTFTANTIGKDLPVVLTASKDGVSKEYTGQITINPEVTVTLGETQLPENGYLDVTSSVGAPNGAVFSITVDDAPITDVDGRYPLSGLPSGGHELGWTLSYNDDVWSGTAVGEFAIVESKEGIAVPSGELSDVAGEDKIVFINSVLEAIIAPGTLYDTTDGKSNLDRSFIILSDGTRKLSSYTSGGYTFWGEGSGDSFELTVKMSDGRLFKMKSEGGSYYFNDELVESGQGNPDRPSDATSVGTDSPHFPAWLQGSYVGHINDTFYREGWSYLTFSDDDFTILSYNGKSQDFTSMYGQYGVAITGQWSNDTDYWECTLEGGRYGLTYIIRKTGDGITVDYDYIYGYDIANDTIAMTSVGDITRGGEAGFEIPDWAYGTFEGKINWNGLQGITATIANDGTITMTLADGTSHTFDSFYGDIDIVMQLKYDDTWDVTFDSSRLANRDLTFYSVTRTDDGMSVICVADIANGYEGSEVIELTKTATVPDDPADVVIGDYTELASPVEPSYSAPAGITEMAGEDEQLVVSVLGSNISSYMLMSLATNMEGFKNREYEYFDLSLEPEVLAIDVDFTKPMTLTARYSNGEPIEVTVGVSSFCHMSMGDNSATLHFTYNELTYTAELETNEDGGLIVSSMYDSGNNDCTATMSRTATAVYDAVNQAVSIALYGDSELINKVLNKDLALRGMGIFNVSSFDMNVIEEFGQPFPDAGFIASLLNVPCMVYGIDDVPVTLYISSPGLVVDISYPVTSVKGPVIADGVKYYVDVTMDASTYAIEGGIWSNGTWKALSM